MVHHIGLAEHPANHASLPSGSELVPVERRGSPQMGTVHQVAAQPRRLGRVRTVTRRINRSHDHRDVS